MKTISNGCLHGTFLIYYVVVTTDEQYYTKYFTKSKFIIERDRFKLKIFENADIRIFSAILNFIFNSLCIWKNIFYT